MGRIFEYNKDIDKTAAYALADTGQELTDP